MGHAHPHQRALEAIGTALGDRMKHFQYFVGVLSFIERHEGCSIEEMVEILRRQRDNEENTHRILLKSWMLLDAAGREDKP